MNDLDFVALLGVSNYSAPPQQRPVLDAGRLETVFFGLATDVLLAPLSTRLLCVSGGMASLHDKSDEFEEHQFILRLPEELAGKFQDMCEGAHLKPENDVGVYLCWDKGEEANNRTYALKIGDETFHAILQDLPTTTESYKTLDRKTFYKSTNICQVVEVVIDPERVAQLTGKGTARQTFSPDGLSEAAKEVYHRFHEPARKLIYGNGTDHATAKATENILNAWLQENRTRTITRKELKDKEQDMSKWGEDTYELVDDDGKPLDGELLDDQTIAKLVSTQFEKIQAHKKAEAEQKRQEEERRLEVQKAAAAEKSKPLDVKPEEDDLKQEEIAPNVTEADIQQYNYLEADDVDAFADFEESGSGLGEGDAGGIDFSMDFDGDELLGGGVDSDVEGEEGELNSDEETQDEDDDEEVDMDDFM
eukprot:Stramenopile-MAST_4_protein_1835